VANTCYNLLTITGPADEVSKFVRKANGRRHHYREEPAPEAGTDLEALCFHALYPVPQAILDSPYHPTGHDWQVAHWGTKWSLNSHVIVRAPAKVQYSYHTAWGPATEFLNKVASDFPALRLEMWSLLEWDLILGVAWEDGIQVQEQGRKVTEREAKAFAEGDEDGSLSAFLWWDITGNPFHSLPPLPASVLTWHGGTVVRLAQAAYDNRQLPSGDLDPARLAVLADALEEAGATDAELLGHLRSPGPHVRGCHGVDLILQRG
jgi:hypothetical protein